MLRCQHCPFTLSIQSPPRHVVLRLLRTACLVLASCCVTTGGAADPADAPPPAASPLTEAQLDEWFQTAYRLEPSQVLRRIPPPFSPLRLQHYRVKDPSQAASIPDGPSTQWIHWTDGQADRWGHTFGGEVQSIDQLAEMILKTADQEISGPPDLRESGLSGDFVFDPDAPQAQLLEALQRELTAAGVNVLLEYRNLERDVYVCRETYDLTPLPDSPHKEIEFFGLRLDTDGSGYGGGSGNIDEMLQEAGSWIEVPIVNESTTPKEIRMSWHRNLDGGFDALEEGLARDPELVLSNLTVQTGLTFTPERRPIKMLVVEMRLP